MIGLVSHLEAAGCKSSAIRAARRTLRFTQNLASAVGHRLHALAALNLASALAAADRFRDSLPFWEQGYLQLRELSSPEDGHRTQLAHASIGLASVYVHLGQTDRASPLVEEAWAIHSELVARNRGAYLRDFLSTALLAGMISFQQGDRSKAKMRREMAVAYFIRLAKAHPAAYREELVWYLVELAKAFYNEADCQSALRWIGKAVREGKQLKMDQPNGVPEVLAVALLNQAIIREKIGSRSAARESALAARTAVEHLPTAHLDRPWMLELADKLICRFNKTRARTIAPKLKSR